MRQLRVVGLSDDGETVIVEDPIRHERFSVPGDERLRAAARGDIRRLGQMEIEHTSPLRPRDIQARIRAGESVDQVAAGGGVSVGHVERFAYPVLLERARVAEMAGRAHPLHATRPDPDAPLQDPRTLGEIVAATFAARGQDYEEARWDAWKGDDAQWAVMLSWQAGRSDNTATWTFRPGSGGGVVLARDDHARDLVGETPAGPRRVDGASEKTERTEKTEKPAEAPAETATPETSEGAGAPAPAEQEALDEVPEALAASGDTVPSRRRPATGGGSAVTRSSRPARSSRSRGVPDQRDARRGEARAAGSTPTEQDTPTPGSTDPASAPVEPAPARGGKRRNHPIVPSWEDVLLGTRSPRT